VVILQEYHHKNLFESLLLAQQSIFPKFDVYCGIATHPVTVARQLRPYSSIPLRTFSPFKYLSIPIKWDSWQYKGGYPLKDITATSHVVISISVVEHLYDF